MVRLPRADQALHCRLASILALALLSVLSLAGLPAPVMAQSASMDAPPAPSPRALRRQRESQRLMADVARALEQGHAEEAVALARRLVRRDRQDPDAHTLLAVALSANGQAELAGQSHRDALALAPQRGGLLNNLGAWLCAQGHAAEALVLIERARRDPQHNVADVAANAGICAARAGQYRLAEAELRQALGLLPGHPAALASMARVQLALGQAMSARAFYQRRLAAAPVDASVLQLAIEIEQRLGDGAAAAHYTRWLAELQGEAPAASQKVENGEH